MKKFATGLAILCSIASPISHSGINGTTAHSRANCANNESITWWLGHAYDWRVISIHRDTKARVQHHIDTGYANTWRQAAVHWGEAPICNNNWSVTGHHFLLDYAGGRYPFESTYADDCSIYDGWWDYN
ncbi:hypothetical protein E3226_007445 [Legionella geestiana]|uniref:hypothetical protein n=1 Tax=Legionella geestiana TaxID=45065 RepID=UPI0010919E19|nr:hypothetical protein [Legionella geestiana]QDQ40241.1 hypothetical protein E3226_007445 [Legionella geestiana]